MSSRRTSSRPSREERRSQLLDAAINEIRTVGPGASMEQLAKAGGVTKPILYRHFGDREGLTRALGDHFAGVLIERLTASLQGDDPEQLLWKTVDAYLGFLEEEPHLYSFMTNSPVGTEQTSAIIDAIARQVAVTIGDGFRAAGIDAGAAEPYAYGIVGMVHQAGDWWVRHRTMSRTALTTYLADLLWLGLLGIGARTLESADGAGSGGRS